MFDASARHLNFGLAAEELHLTQGAVAQQVRKLEQELDVKLFHRLARGLALTEAGQNYSGSVRKAMKIIDEATLKLSSQCEGLKLSVPPSLAAKWLMPRLKLFQRSYPDIKVKIVASETLANFRNDEIDLAIRMGQPPFAQNVDARLLAVQELCAVCSPSYALEIGEIDDVGDLANYELIYDDHSRWDAIIANLPARGMTFNQTALAMDAALDGQGIALVPSLLAKTSFANDELVELWRDRTPSSLGYYIICSNVAEVNPSRQAMMDWLMAQV